MRPALRSLLAATATALALTWVASLSTAYAATVRAEEPFDLPEQIADRAGVLDDTSQLRDELADLQRDTGLQLFVAYVDSFESLSGEEWAARTYESSGMGGQDVCWQSRSRTSATAPISPATPV